MLPTISNASAGVAALTTNTETLDARSWLK
jgi:hypothetical protein